MGFNIVNIENKCLILGQRWRFLFLLPHFSSFSFSSWVLYQPDFRLQPKFNICSTLKSRVVAGTVGLYMILTYI